MSQPQKGASRGWGSLLSGAVAGLESRLDNILADEETKTAEDAARKVKAGGAQKPAQLKTEDSTSRAPSKSRGNDRLAERLAKATKGAAGNSRPGSEAPSRTASPLPRQSNEIKAEGEEKSEDLTEANRGDVQDGDAGTVEATKSALTDTAPVRTSTSSFIQSNLSSTRQSLESGRPSVESLPQAETAATAPLRRSPSFLEAEVDRITQAHDDNTRNFNEELHAHLERIDALQSKLEYLAKQASATAREAANSAAPGSLEKKLAEQEEKNALLLEEGNKLSKVDIKQRGAIIKLRSKFQEEEKDNAVLRRKLVTSEEERSDLRDRLRIVEEREKAAQARLKALAKLEGESDTFKRERDEVRREAADLRKGLAEAEKRAESAEKRAQTDKLEEQMRVVAELNDELSNARIEKRLVEDRGKAEIRQLKENAARQEEKSQQAQLELQNEIQSLETRLELLRSKTEEATSSTTTDAQAKLLRQVETLQTQYALASENWQTLESTLNARVVVLEKERDDIAKRETDVRKKAREVNAKARRYEEDLEGEKDKASAFEAELNEQKAALAKLQTRLAAAEVATAEAKAKNEQDRRAWERELQSKLEEERARLRLEHNHSQATTPIVEHSQFLRTESPTASWTNRKASDSGLLGLYSRRSNAGSNLPPVLTDRPPSRRTPPVHPGLPVRTPTGDSSQFSRDWSSSHLASLNGTSYHATGSITPSNDIDAIDDRLDRNSDYSPHRTVNELVSVSTTGAGPSVQLVERMSAAVRRLESEKASNKEEYARMVAQRDEAREEVVGLMREVDNLRKTADGVAKLETEMADIKVRYEASLEMLGEKSEEVEELRDDLEEVKKIYKELADRSLK